MARILLVEDDDDMRAMLALMLESAGHDVATAPDGQEALGAVRDGGMPDIVVSDVRMPYTDGVALLGRLRQQPNGATLPILFITALHLDERIQELSGHPYTGLLAKPVAAPDLLSAVGELLDGG